MLSHYHPPNLHTVIGKASDHFIPMILWCHTTVFCYIQNIGNITVVTRQQNFSLDQIESICRRQCYYKHSICRSESEKTCWEEEKMRQESENPKL